MKRWQLRAGVCLICLFAFCEVVAYAYSQEVEEVQTPSSKLPRIIIRDNIIKDSGIGIYWTTQGKEGEEDILIVNNLIINNGEGIRWASSTLGRIQGNELRGNLIALKVIGEYIAPGGVVTPLRVSPVILRLNNILDSREYAVLNLTDVPVIADENFWGDPSGPLASDRPKLKLQAGLQVSRFSSLQEEELKKVAALSLRSLAASDAGLSLGVTLAALEAQGSLLEAPKLELTIATLAMLYDLQPAQEPTPLPEVVKGLVELKSWLDSPVSLKEEKKEEMKEEGKE